MAQAVALAPTAPRRAEPPSRARVDPLSLILYASVLLVAGLGLAAADWTDHLARVPTVGILGAIAGAALARSRFRYLPATLFGVCYGAFLVGLQAGLTLDPALPWRDRIFDLVGRTGAFLGALAAGEVNRDGLVFVILMMTLFWIMGSAGSWALIRRGRLWLAVGAPVVALTIDTAFYVGPARIEVYLAIVLALALVLASRDVVVRREAVWRRTGARVPLHAALDIGRAGALLAAFLVWIAWVGPAFAESPIAARWWASASTPLREAIERAGNAFAGLRGRVAMVHDLYGESLPLGAGLEPEDILVMEVWADRTPSRNGRFYWRARTYNRYHNGGWSSSSADSRDFDPEQGPLSLPPQAGREVIDFTFAPRLPALRTLFLPTQPLWVNRSGEMTSLSGGDPTSDLVAIQAARPVVRGERYRARASVAVPSATALRQAGEEYPDWIRQAYLPLPPEITPRTRALAEEITRGLDNPYDKAEAITAWLRSNIRYSRTTPPPPPDSEPVDWFLFEYRTGFCNYYASAEVVLLRSLGIPARMAVGYARGVFDPDRGAFQVRGGQAHAWPEVYFPGYGWVEFEPTVSQPPLSRPEVPLDEESASGNAGDLPLAGDEGGAFDRELLPDEELAGGPGGGVGGIPEPTTSWTWVLYLAAVFLAAASVLRAEPATRAAVESTLIWGLRRAGLRPPQRPSDGPTGTRILAASSYRAWAAWMRRLGLPAEASRPPYERARSFAEAVPAAASEGWAIATAYAAERFGGIHPEERELWRAWWRMLPHLWKAWTRRGFRRAFRR